MKHFTIQTINDSKFKITDALSSTEVINVLSNLNIFFIKSVLTHCYLTVWQSFYAEQK